jgi:hypothetical protein
MGDHGKREGGSVNIPTIYWRLVWRTPLVRVRWLRMHSTAVWCRWYQARTAAPLAPLPRKA